MLPDPAKLLKGSGNRVRTIRLDDAALLDRPEVRALIAVANADSPFVRRRPRRLLIKSISTRERSRRPR
jgi:hypothetical protein